MPIILCYSILNFADTLEDAERIKIEQTKRIETLERDLKVANSKRGVLKAKNEPLTRAIETIQPQSVIETKQTIICQSFSDDNYNVTVSSCKRSVTSNGFGYCFLNHPKLQKNQILKWSVRVPKHKYGWIGMVIMLDKIKFYLLMIAFKRYWYICQSTN